MGNPTPTKFPEGPERPATGLGAAHRRVSISGLRPAKRTAARSRWPEPYCTTDLLPSVEPPIGAPSGSGRPAVGTPSR